MNPVNQTGHGLFYLHKCMKATIKVCKDGKFTPSDIDILRRVANVLREHQLSVQIEMKVKQTLKLKAV